MSFYDFSKCAGQQYFMREAKKRGTEILIGFSNSPLVCWTKSGTGNNIVKGSPISGGNYTSQGRSANLQDDKYDDYANYLGDVAEYFNGQSVVDNYGNTKSLRFNYISPVNEPQYEWNQDKQEGSWWTNLDIAKISRELNLALSNPIRSWVNIVDGNLNLDDNKLPKIMITEAANWGNLSSGSSHL